MIYPVQSDDRSADLWLAYQRAMATYRLYVRELEDGSVARHRAGGIPVFDQDTDGRPPIWRGPA